MHGWVLPVELKAPAPRPAPHSERCGATPTDGLLAKPIDDIPAEFTTQQPPTHATLIAST